MTPNCGSQNYGETIMSTPFNEHWLEMGACVPVDIETTAAFVAEIHRLIDVIGGMALAQKQERLTENGMYRLGYHNGYGFGKAYGKANPSQRTWVGLTDDEQQQAYEQWQSDGWGVFYNAIEAKLKEKNT
jgi:hypothetical protein